MSSVGRLKVQVYSKNERQQRHTEKGIEGMKSSSQLTKYKHKWVILQIALADYLKA